MIKVGAAAVIFSSDARMALSLLAFLFVASIAASQTPGPKDKKSETPASQPKEKPPTPAAKEPALKTKPINQLKLPNGTIIIVVDNVKEALNQSPDAIVLSPAMFQDLL